jgi:hypothetical protein
MNNLTDTGVLPYTFMGTLEQMTRIVLPIMKIMLDACLEKLGIMQKKQQPT